MTIEEIRDAKSARPFARFTLVLDDGRHLPVKEPYFLGISPQGTEITCATDRDGFKHFAAKKVVRILPGIVNGAEKGHA